MKKLLFMSIIFAALSSSVQAATVTAIADQYLGSTGSFALGPTGTSMDSPIDKMLLKSIVTSDITTYVVSNISSASIDLGFGPNTTAYTGSGTDLVIFTIGNGYNFGLQVFGVGDDINPISSFSYSVNIIEPNDPSYISYPDIYENGYDPTLRDPDTNDELCINDAIPCPAVLSGTNIDLLGIADGTEISKIRLLLGTAYNGIDGDTPHFSLARAEHATVVPLPLPAILFSSGLLLLGWVGRRKTV